MIPNPTMWATYKKMVVAMPTNYRQDFVLYHKITRVIVVQIAHGHILDVVGFTMWHEEEIKANHNDSKAN